MTEPAEVPKRRSRGSIWLGLGIFVAAFLVAWGISVAVGYTSPLAQYLGPAFGLGSLALVVAGIALSAFEKTRRTGAGILLGIGATILIYAGICFAYFG